MPAFNFQPRFADAVMSGQKRQTIRRRRVHNPHVGQLASCFTGLRTKKCRKLGAWIITDVIPIEYQADAILIIQADGAVKRLSAIGHESLAKDDGFEDAKDMHKWFLENHKLPFRGVIVRW